MYKLIMNLDIELFTQVFRQVKTRGVKDLSKLITIDVITVVPSRVLTVEVYVGNLLPPFCKIYKIFTNSQISFSFTCFSGRASTINLSTTKFYLFIN